ncbi:sensor histidine kinase [Microbispora sp. CA-102843]|uniref:sensor histidine kinase n=1 Tax=Microbispora sp. CA-102843 TaxID=3239952 RepID=UPI003D8A046F
MVRRWRDDMRHLLVSGVIGAAGLGLFVLTVAAAGFGLVGGLGLPVFVRAVELTRRLADVQRRRTGAGIPSPYPPMPDDGLLARVRTITGTPATWRDLLWAVSPLQYTLPLVAVGLCLAGAEGVLMPLLWLAWGRVEYEWLVVTDLPGAFAAVAVGVVTTALACLAPRAFVRLEAAQARWLLAPTTATRLNARIARLTETRTQTVDASAAELRRIERDLHDGAQARLVALAMNLGMAEDLFDADPDTARALLADARTGAHTAMTELRDLVRGIHPPLLADRGVGGALHAIALTSPVPVELDMRLDRRLAPPVESAAYFTVVEAITNAVKHSQAGRITVTVEDLGDRLALRVADDGRGGADPTRGTGLRGIERRLAAFDGSMRVTSPLGGPTTVEAELPCAS